MNLAKTLRITGIRDFIIFMPLARHKIWNKIVLRIEQIRLSKQIELCLKKVNFSEDS